MEQLMEGDPKIVACTAAMPDGTGLASILEAFPDRSWDTGICESHAVDMMAGLAKTGWKPFFAVYSTFLQRAFDQTFQEIALQGLPLRLCLDRAGLVGGDGAVHHGFCDIALLSALPGAVLMGAMDEPSLKAALSFMANYQSGLSAVRYPRESVTERSEASDCPPFELGKARPLVEHDTPDVAVFGYGVMSIEALKALDLLEGEFNVNIYDARFAKPVDEALLADLLRRSIPVITVEDHSLKGGFGTQVLEACNRRQLDGRLVHRLGLPDHWIYQGARAEQLAEAGIDASAIARTIRMVVATQVVPLDEPAAEDVSQANRRQ
jgi:1-deoxy-D-xylulose-5-phosphate synthase